MKRLLVALMLLSSPVFAHDYERPELKDWFMHLHSGHGPCCDGSDATHVADPDWENNSGHYKVRIEGKWVDVPDDAVINEPNKEGTALVWVFHLQGEAVIRCFMPGAGT